MYSQVFSNAPRNQKTYVFVSHLDFIEGSRELNFMNSF